MQWLLKPIGDVIMIMSIFYSVNALYSYWSHFTDFNYKRWKGLIFLIYITQSFNISNKASNTWKKELQT